MGNTQLRPFAKSVVMVIACVAAACDQTPTSTTPDTRSTPPAASAQRPSIPEDRAQEIVDRCIQAHGGIEAWRNLRDVSYREIRERYDHPQRISTRNIHLKRWNGDWMVRIEVTGGSVERLGPDGTMRAQPVDDLIVLGYDGDEYWEIEEGHPVTDSTALESTRYVVTAWRYWFSLPWALKDPGVRLVFQGEDTIEGRPVYLIEVGFETGTGDNPGDRFLYFINRDTYIVENLRYWRQGRSGPGREFRMREYVQVAGLLHDSLRVYHVPGGRSDGTKRTEIVSFNSDLPDEMFLADALGAGSLWQRRSAPAPDGATQHE